MTAREIEKLIAEKILDNLKKGDVSLSGCIVLGELVYNLYTDVELDVDGIHVEIFAGVEVNDVVICDDSKVDIKTVLGVDTDAIKRDVYDAMVNAFQKINLQ